MKTFPILVTSLACACLTALAAAAPELNPYFTTLSGVQDTSNMLNGSTTFGFSLTTNSIDPTTYINEISYVGDSSFDSNVTFNVADYGGNVGHLGNGFSNNDYTLGTALGSNQTYYWSDVFHHDGAFSSAIAPGSYHFDALFKGGADASATDTLFDIPLTVEIVPNIDVTETESQDVTVINQGGTATVSSTITNHMNRNFVSTTWYTEFINNGTDGLAFNFVGDWFDQTVAPGDSRTDFNTTQTADINASLGMYSGNTGVVGGLYNGDNFYFGSGVNTNIQVVPEPASMLALAGFGFLVVRRRKR